MENEARLDGVGQQDLKEQDQLTTACSNIFSWLRDLRTLTNESAQSDDAENIDNFKAAQSTKTREEGNTEDSVDTCDTPWQKSSLGTAPVFASNLEKRQKSPPTWLSILEWLPTSEALQAGLSLGPPEETAANGRVFPQGFSTSQLNKGTADRDEKKSESGDEGSGAVSRQHIKQLKEEQRASKGVQAPAGTAKNSLLKNSPLAFACREAEEDDENLERLAVVKALREWVLMQPVFLGRPVASDNPTFYSLYLRWAKQQARDSDSDEEREQSPGRTSSIEVEEDTFPVTTQKKSSTSQPGRQHKASVPSHLSSFEMYEESWLQGKRDSNHAASSPHKHSFNSCGSKKKRVTEKLRAEQEQRRHSTSGPPFGASPMSCSKRKNLPKDEEEAEADFVSTKRGNSAPSSRRGSLHLILNHDDEEPELTTPKPGSKGRGVPKKISVKQEDESDADVETRVAGKKRRRESGKESEVAEMDDPTFVPTSPPEVAKSENGKRGPGKKKKRAKKDDKLKHLRPATVESCHRCKNRKEYWMGCPIIEAHRYCKGCVERHFNLDYELYSVKSAEIWADGCPICKLTCQCAACRRRKEALDAGISPPAKRRKGEDSDYHNGGQVDEEGNGRQRRTRSQSKEDSKEAKKVNAKAAAIENRHLKKKAANSVDESEEEEEESDSVQEEEEQEERKASPAHSNGRKSPSAVGSPQRVTRAQTRLRAKGKSPRKDHEEESEGEEPEDREIQPAAPSLVGSNGGVRKENGYYVLEDSDNVEAFVGLTGAGSVLSRRYSGSSSLPRLPSVKILGGGW